MKTFHVTSHFEMTIRSCCEEHVRNVIDSARAVCNGNDEESFELIPDHIVVVKEG